MTVYADAPLETLQDFFTEMAVFRKDQCDVIPERTIELLKEAALFTSLARMSLQVSPIVRDRFVRAVHEWSHDDLQVRRATWEVAEQVGIDETLLTAEGFLSRVCDTLARRSFAG